VKITKQASQSPWPAAGLLLFDSATTTTRTVKSPRGLHLLPRMKRPSSSSPVDSPAPTRPRLAALAPILVPCEGLGSAGRLKLRVELRGVAASAMKRMLGPHNIEISDPQ
jgi:hypothetical protein